MVQKSFLLSKTFWLNFVVGLLAGLLPMFPALQPVSDFIKNHVMEIGIAWSMLNVVLRFVSHEKIVLVD
jgi:hypothetical protein